MPDQAAMPPAGAATAAVCAREVSDQDGDLPGMLFPHMAGLRVYRAEDTGEAVVISASCRAQPARCPRCGQQSSRVHGGYSRLVADGAAGADRVAGTQVPLLQLIVPGGHVCRAGSGLTSRYRRRSVPLTAMLAGSGLELAGRAGARLAGLLGIAVHPSSVLRLVAALPEPQVTAAPGVLGADDFALRKGRVHGPCW